MNELLKDSFILTGTYFQKQSYVFILVLAVFFKSCLFLCLRLNSVRVTGQISIFNNIV